MPRRNPPEKWVLPETIDPAVRRCIQIPVPDDPAHIAAFRGAMLALQSAYNWADDPTHKAKDVALVWRSIIDGLTNWGCDNLPQTILQADPSGCGVQWSLDEGVNWNTIDLSDCIGAIAADQFGILFPSAFSDALQQAIADGTVAVPGTQQSPSNPPLPGDCQTFYVVLSAREQWICPVPVAPGSTISISNLVGGWTDGAVGWYCPDGKAYGLGLCAPASEIYEATDPKPDSYHMTPVGHLQIDGDWFSPMGGGYTLPPGKAEQLFILQANDQSLGDNFGEINFTVQVCTAGWTRTLDFTAGDHGWSIMPMAGNDCGVYVAGVGFQSATCAPYRYLTAGKAITPTIITKIRVTSNRLYSEAFEGAGHLILNGDAVVFSESNTLPAGESTFEWTGQVNFSQVGILLSAYTSTGDTINFTSIYMEGTGTDPF